MISAKTLMNGSNERELPPGLVLRSFRPSDDEACQLLEIRANQHKNPKLDKLPGVSKLLETLFQVYPAHPQGFDACAKLSDEHEIVVCHDTTRDTVVGVIVVNIRKATWVGRESKVGWVYELRVDEDYQRQGIARALSNELETRCRQRGVVLLYLTVNLENTKAQALYQALGWKPASHRGAITKFLNNKADLRMISTEREYW